MEALFALITLAALAGLAINWYGGYRFDNNPLPEAITLQIAEKERQIIALVRQRYAMEFDVPVVVSDKIDTRLYGLAAYAPDGRITVVLNKKRMKESLGYILDDVLPHEYAHALMFRLGNVGGDDGHNEQWQKICRALGGSRCDRFVNHGDVVMGKIAF